MPTLRRNRIKLHDIAQEAGVSLAAVSLALSDKPGISQETRARVIEVARALGYRFKTPASAAAGKSLRTIGLLVKSVSQSESNSHHSYAPVMTGIEATCRQMGLNLLFSNLPVNDDNFPVDIPPLLEKPGVDGLVLVGVNVDEAVGRILNDRGCPVVLIDSYSQTCQFDAVQTDNYTGAHTAANYLIRRGHRHIGFVGGSAQASPGFRDRRVGYRQALNDHGIQEIYFADCSTCREEVSAAAVNLLQKNQKITALMGVNDEAAIVAMYALIEAGIRVPQSISIIGFDDIYLAGSVVPSLTTMHIDYQSMGRLAVQLLTNHAAQPASGCVTSIFRPTLIERNSVARLSESPA